VSEDNGAELALWPGVVKPRAEINDIVTLMGWMPTFANAAGLSDLKEQMKSGFKSGTKDFKVQLDDYHLVPLLKGRSPNPSALLDGKRSATGWTCLASTDPAPELSSRNSRRNQAR